MMKSSSLSARSLAAVWHPCTQMQRAQHLPPLAIARAQGAWLYAEDGARYFDALSSWWVNLFGHADADISAAIKAQLDTLPHVMLAGCTHAPAVELAEGLRARTGGHLGHAFYGSDGASAVEMALKMAHHYWRNQGQPGKERFVCLQGSYHGETLGALGVTDVPIFSQTYAQLLRSAIVISSPACANTGGQAARMEVALAALEQTLKTRHHEIAALIVEPLVQAAGGMLFYPPAYLRQARALCTQYDVLLIADEIAVGCGRTGRFFAWEHALPEAADDQPSAQDWPDFVLLSKAITGGFLPLSVVLSTDAVYAAFLSPELARGFLHSHSYTGNALACAAGVAVLRKLANGGLAQAVQQAQYLQAAFAPFAADARLENLRQCGTLWAADIAPAYAHGAVAERVHSAARHHALLLRPIGRTIYVMPPLLLDAASAQWLAQAVRATLDDALRPASAVVAQDLIDKALP